MSNDREGCSVAGGALVAIVAFVMMVLYLVSAIANAQSLTLTGDVKDDGFLYAGGTGLSGATVQICQPARQGPFNDRGGFFRLDVLNAPASEVQIRIAANNRTLVQSLGNVQAWWPVVSNRTYLRWEAPTTTTTGQPLQLGGFILRYAGNEIEFPPDARDHTILSLQPGSYTFSLSAVDSAGIEGESVSVEKTL